jgi:allantoin racemase
MTDLPSNTRIKFICPRPTDAAGLAAIAEPQIPHDALGPGTSVECVAVRECGEELVCHYEALLMDFYVAEAGLRAEDEGFDAVVIDTVSDSGLDALRSRLAIPVIGSGIVAYSVATMLGHQFSIVTMWDRWKFFYEKSLTQYGLRHKCASIRSINVTPDLDHLLAGKEDEVFPLLADTAQTCIEQDGADVIVLGSTTMYQAGDYLAQRLPVPVINPGRVALKMAETLVDLRLTHSKQAFPSPITRQDWKFGTADNPNAGKLTTRSGREP